MNEATERVVHDWLWLAQRDLVAARQLGNLPDPLLEAAVYHGQQCAEKALKGFLALHGIMPPRIHSIGLLLNNAEPFAPELAHWRTAADALTRAGVEYRYPGELAYLRPDHSEFLAVTQAAEDILSFVLSRTPPVIHPRDPFPEPGPLPPL
jgi:HEPN domain-containing protein